MTNRAKRLLSYERVSDPPGIRVFDRVEKQQYRLLTGTGVDPTPVSTDTFRFGVDRGVRIQTNELRVHSSTVVFVRDRDGTMLTQLDHLESRSFEEGQYVIELDNQVRTYLEVETGFEVTAGMLETTVSLDDVTAVDAGFRTEHTRPMATVTTTDDPRALMQTVSTFGSALKTTSPERTFPMLRGHPPTVSRGDSLDIPPGLEPPETGIRIEVPPACEYIYPVAPLAYLLGATVVPGQQPHIVTDNGFDYPLGGRQQFETTVERVLKQVFLLDAVTRTEGKNKLNMHERVELERSLTLDWAQLYDQPLATRLERFLSVPYELVEPQVPEWRLTAHVDPSPESVRQLPFVVDDLAVVRATEPQPAPTPTTAAATGELTRSSAAGTRSTVGASSEMSLVKPERTDSLEQAWIGDDVPVGASKLTLDAFHNRLDRDPTEGDIGITVVVNNEQMEEEGDIVDRVYGDRDRVPFDVTVRRGLGTEALAATLAADTDFLHYIGHIDGEGFECADGRLDATTLAETGVDAFLLNACSSYRQGLGLVEAGAVGGIVTLADVANNRAVRVGETTARLLNTGFPLRAALSVTREQHILGKQYIVVGDGGMTVTQAASQTPNLLDVTPRQDGFDVTIRTSVTDTAGLGSVFRPHIAENDEFFLSSGEIGTFRVSTEELSTFLDMENVPVRTTDDTLVWSYETSPSELR